MTGAPACLPGLARIGDLRQTLDLFDVSLADGNRIPGFNPGMFPMPEGKTR